jgi:hypothetical protein
VHSASVNLVRFVIIQQQQATQTHSLFSSIPLVRIISFAFHQRNCLELTMRSELQQLHNTEPQNTMGCQWTDNAALSQGESGMYATVERMTFGDQRCMEDREDMEDQRESKQSRCFDDSRDTDGCDRLQEDSLSTNEWPTRFGHWTTTQNELRESQSMARATTPFSTLRSSPTFYDSSEASEAQLTSVPSFMSFDNEYPVREGASQSIPQYEPRSRTAKRKIDDNPAISSLSSGPAATRVRLETSLENWAM